MNRSNHSLTIEDVRNAIEGERALNEQLNQAVHLLFKVSHSLSLPVTVILPYFTKRVLDRHRLIL